MRSLVANPVTPLLGSLGLHGSVVLALLIVVHQPTRLAPRFRERPDAWVGNAVEVDAVATPESAADVPSSAANAGRAEAAPAQPKPTAPVRAPFVTSDGEHVAALPRPARPIRAAKPAPENPLTAAGANGAGAASAPASGAFGGEGLHPGVRSLPSAFTRAIPPATGADPIWQALPIGPERPFTILIEVDAEGHISSADIVREKSGSEPAPQATHLRERVVAMLGGGLFALQNNVGSGRELLRITVTLSDTPVHEDDDPAQLVERGFEPPRGGAPGRAYFTLASGRHFEAKVQVLAQP
jgi:hypothetical protein